MVDVVAKARNIALGIWMPTPEQAGAWIEQGVQMITVASNDMIFYNSCKRYADKVKAQIPGRA